MRDQRDSSLASLQRFVADAIRSDMASDTDPSVVPAADQLLLPSKRGLTPAGRLEIYREQFWLRHVSNLNDDFPTLRWVVGEAAFRELAVAYLMAHPPRTWNLQRLGADLPAYIAKEAPWNVDRLAVDACRLDWAFMEAFDAPDAAPLDLGPLAMASEEAVATARLTFHPSIRMLALDYPVHELREAVRQGGGTKERPGAASARVVVWRDAAFSLKAAAVEPMAFDLLVELADATPLGRACEAIASAHAPAEGEDLGARVGGWFQQWTANGWVSAVQLAA